MSALGNITCFMKYYRLMCLGCVKTNAALWKTVCARTDNKSYWQGLPVHAYVRIFQQSILWFEEVNFEDIADLKEPFLQPLHDFLYKSCSHGKLLTSTCTEQSMPSVHVKSCLRNFAKLIVLVLYTFLYYCDLKKLILKILQTFPRILNNFLSICYSSQSAWKQMVYSTKFVFQVVREAWKI